MEAKTRITYFCGNRQCGKSLGGVTIVVEDDGQLSALAASAARGVRCPEHPEEPKTRLRMVVDEYLVSDEDLLQVYLDPKQSEPLKKAVLEHGNLYTVIGIEGDGKIALASEKSRHVLRAAQTNISYQPVAAPAAEPVPAATIKVPEISDPTKRGSYSEED